MRPSSRHCGDGRWWNSAAVLVAPEEASREEARERPELPGWNVGTMWPARRIVRNDASGPFDGNVLPGTLYVVT